MTGAELLFLLFAVATCGGAVAVVVSQNVVRMAFWLIVSLGSTAGLFFLLSADFVGATQLMVYVGGTLVLLIFGVMLTASGPYVSIKSSPADSFLAAGIGVLFLAMIYMTVYSVDWNEAATAGAAVTTVDPATGFNHPDEGNSSRRLGLSFLGLRLDGGSGYLLPFEIVSVHLLVVLIGAAYLARTKRRVDPGANAEG